MDSQHQSQDSTSRSKSSAGSRHIGSSRRNRLWIASLLAVLAYYLVLLAVWGTASGNSRALADEQTYYLPTITQFAHHFPVVDLSDYPSAMTPAYHLSLAAVMRWVSDSIPFLRLIGSLYGAFMAAILARIMARRLDPFWAVLASLPLVLSLYVISSGAWLLPDNAGWLGMLLMLLLALRSRVDGKTYFFGGLTLLVLVSTRQIHLWTAGPLVLAAWLGRNDTCLPHGSDDTLPARAGRLGMILLSVLPAVVVLLGFCLLWHGLTPPSFQGMYNGRNPAVPATILALAGGYGLFFSGFLVDARQVIGQRWRWILTGAVIGLLAAILPATSYNYDAGRSSGIWNVVARLPVIADRSVLILGLSILGGMIGAAWLAILPRRDAIILAFTAVCFAGAMTSNPFAWQRYIEPFVLIWLALAVFRSISIGGQPMSVGQRLLCWMPVGLLALIQLAITLLLTVFSHRTM